jgi:hypothetical protein
MGLIQLTFRDRVVANEVGEVGSLGFVITALIFVPLKQEQMSWDGHF